MKTSPQGSGSPGTPSTTVDRGAAKRAELRRMEQERRRREAVSQKLDRRAFLFEFQKKKYLFVILFICSQMAGQIDMNMQSDLMAAFEESLEKK